MSVEGEGKRAGSPVNMTELVVASSGEGFPNKKTTKRSAQRWNIRGIVYFEDDEGHSPNARAQGKF